MTRSLGPQIRGGEAAAFVRLSGERGFLPRRRDRYPDRLRLAEHAALRQRDCVEPRQPGPARSGLGRGAGDDHQIRGPGDRPAVEGHGCRDPGWPAEHGRPGSAGRVGRPVAGCHPGGRRQGPETQGTGSPESEFRRYRSGVQGELEDADGLPPGSGDQGRRPLEHQRQRGDRPRRAAWRGPFRCRLSDHAGDRGSRVAGAEPGAPGRRTGPGRGRAGVDQYGDRRFVRRGSESDGDLGPRAGADDRGDRPFGGFRDAGSDHRRAARRSVDGHPDQVGAERPQHRGQRSAWGCAAYRDGVHFGGGLHLHGAMDRLPGRGPAEPGHRADRSASRPDPGHCRRSGEVRHGCQARGCAAR